MVFADEHSVRIRGHSGYADEGKDIICAAVSALFLNTEKSIHDLTDDVIESHIEPGRGTIKFENLSERGKLLINLKQWSNKSII